MVPIVKELSFNGGTVTLSTQQPDGPVASRALRADARRNVERILQAAEEVFATQGLAVPIDVVAARAGVGIGTVYRHFPTKEALFEAIVVARLEGLVQRAQQLSTAGDPGDAVFTFVAEIAELATSKKDLSDELARAGIDSDHVHSTIKDELESAFTVLLQRAQAVGAVRQDVTTADVTALLMGTCMAADNRGDRASTCRLVAILCDGLRAQS
jgi:AcrR family transcriptional regulator